jgi:hypothetical protein
VLLPRTFSALLFLPTIAFAGCIPFTQARDHIGETQCITGTVLRVKSGARGLTYFDFCQDFRVCPFTVVIFPGHMKDIGDVRQLQNRQIEIHGELKSYDGRAEIILSQLRQLGSSAAKIPKLPKEYDVENKGHYSAGKFSLPKASKHAAKKRTTPTLPAEVSDEGEPE